MLQALEFVVAFILVLAPLVFIHELGHFLAAKMFGIGVPVFSLGFGPRLFGFRRRETDYRVSLIPLGGYVRMTGDESDEHRVGASNEFLSKPRWQRLVVFSAGAAFNIALAFLVMWFYFAYYGKIDVPHVTVYDVAEGSEAAAAGVQRGDKLIEIAGHDVQENFLYHYNLEIALAPDTTKQIVVDRDGQRVALELSTGSDPKLGMGDPGWSISFAEGDTSVIDQVLPDSAAEAAGLLAGDHIVGAGGKDSISRVELRVMLEANVDKDVALRIERDGSVIPIVVRPRLGTAGRGVIGVAFESPPIQTVRLSLGAAAAESLRWNVDLSKTLFVVLKRMITTELSIKTMSGPVGIAQVARDALISGPHMFLYLLGFFSLQLGILNLLPIPILDGGHILILLIEGVMRRNLSDTVKERVMQVGLVFLLAFMGVIIFLDVAKIF